MVRDRPPISDLPSLHLADTGLEQLKTLLITNFEAWKAVSSDFKRELLDHIDQYQTFCGDLRARQSAIIQDAYSRSLAPHVLEDYERYMIPPVDRYMFITTDKIISYMPKNTGMSENRHEAINQGVDVCAAGSQPLDFGTQVDTRRYDTATVGFLIPYSFI